MTNRQEALKKKEALLERFNAVLSDPAKVVALAKALRENKQFEGMLIKQLNLEYKRLEPYKRSWTQRIRRALNKFLMPYCVHIGYERDLTVDFFTYKVAEGRTSIEVTVVGVNSPGYPLLTYTIADF